ncbi:hypothetical protein L6R53_02075 [Myxococcota bacterium]|nr:hypothetical protein [Myxococcota bacterium]
MTGTRAGLALPVTAFLLAAAARVAVVLATPTPYAFDAFQRWAGRHHLLVRDWQPGAQLLIALVAALGGDHQVARLALSLVAALGVAAGAVAARRMAGPAGDPAAQAAGWLFVPVGVFGPWLCWSAALYQEGTYLALVLGGLALALRARAGEGRWWPADLLVGLAALTRTEGLPLVALYLSWRRDPRALVAAVGPLAWIALRALAGPGYAPSPVDYADWEGLTDRLSATAWLADLGLLGRQAFDSGGLLLLALGLVGGALALRRGAPAARLVLLFLLAQAAAVAGWLAGLETAIVRMQVVPAALLGLLAAAGLGPLLRSPPRRAAAALLAALLAALGLQDGLGLARRAAAAFAPEARLLAELPAPAAGGPVLVSPRTGLGTRDRHDGCEVLLGLSELREGRDLVCQGWPASTGPAPVLRATWADGRYRLEALP